MATEIVFAKDEVVEHVALGDTVSWEVAPAANSLFIKPRERAGRTNLTVITRSRYGPRSYRFALSPTQRGSGFYTDVFRYPEQEAAEAQAQAAIDRKSVVEGKSGSVRVDFGGARLNKKTK